MGPAVEVGWGVSEIPKQVHSAVMELYGRRPAEYRQSVVGIPASSMNIQYIFNLVFVSFS